MHVVKTGWNCLPYYHSTGHMVQTFISRDTVMLRAGWSIGKLNVSDMVISLM